MTRYDDIGHGYSVSRRADPRIAAAVVEALGDARTVLNVGAGAGSYEPADRHVVAVEPSACMLAQRAPDAAPAVRASAESLPFADRTVDASMAMLTVHHWEDLDRGLAELVRVARRRVVVLTGDIETFRAGWLIRDYLADAMAAHLDRFPSVERVAGCLPGAAIRTVPVPRDCTDAFLAAFWGRPEAYLDPELRAVTSPWHDAADEAAKLALDRLAGDLRSGEWDRRHGHLRHDESHDVGLRLVVAELAG